MTKAEDIYHSHVNYEWNDVSDNLKKSIISAINEAINYTHCCETLPSSYAEGYNDAIAKIKEEAKYIDKQ